jgi:hypothetical protein
MLPPVKGVGTVGGDLVQKGVRGREEENKDKKGIGEDNKLGNVCIA